MPTLYSRMEGLVGPPNSTSKNEAWMAARDRLVMEIRTTRNRATTAADATTAALYKSASAVAREHKTALIHATKAAQLEMDAVFHQSAENRQHIWNEKATMWHVSCPPPGLNPYTEHRVHNDTAHLAFWDGVCDHLLNRLNHMRFKLWSATRQISDTSVADLDLQHGDVVDAHKDCLVLLIDKAKHLVSLGEWTYRGHFFDAEIRGPKLKPMTAKILGDDSDPSVESPDVELHCPQQ